MKNIALASGIFSTAYLFDIMLGNARNDLNVHNMVSHYGGLGFYGYSFVNIVRTFLNSKKKK